MRGWKLCCPVVWLTDLWNKLRSRLCKLRIGQYLFGQRAGSLGTDVRWLWDSFSSDYARFRLEVDHVVKRRQFRSAMWLLAIAAWVFSNWNLSVPSQTNEPARQTTELITPAAVFPPREQQSAGWVFGRLIGFPGADRPALGRPQFVLPR